MAFVRGGENDGGYLRKEVLVIVYKFHNAFQFHQYITTIHNEHAKGGAVNIPAFDPLELQKVNDLLGLMIVSSYQGGNFVLNMGNW
jgi:hypothetical protein